MTLAEAEYEVLEYILKFVPDAGTAPLAGNTIGTDRAFLAKYMPRVDGHLHYRSVDVSIDQGARPPLVSRACTSRRRRRTAGTARSPTSSSRSASSTTTAGSCSSPSPARPASRRRRHPPRRWSHGHPSCGNIVGLPALRRGGRCAHGGCSSVGRALACGAGCRGFESRHPPHVRRLVARAVQHGPRARHDDAIADRARRALADRGLERSGQPDDRT